VRKFSDGRLYVSPKPNLACARLDRWLFLKVFAYSEANPKVINYLHSKARVFLPESARLGVTAPEPDLAAYHQFPLESERGGTSARSSSPKLW
jgi:hypothetical protein